MDIKKILIVFLLLSVFIVGTLTFTDTVEAAKWKKYDSGSYNEKGSFPGFKNKVSYVTYIKDSKNIKINFYQYKAKNNKKVLGSTLYLIKSGKNVKIYGVENGKKSGTSLDPYSGTIKNYYKKIIKPKLKSTK